MFEIFRTVYSKGRSWGITIGVAVIIFACIILIQNIDAIHSAFSAFGFLFMIKIIGVVLFYSYQTTHLSVFLFLIIISLFAGVNVTLLYEATLRRREQVRKRDAGANGLAVFLGILGVGCASCGTLLVAPLLSFFGLTWILTILPFGGLEFMAVAVLLLGLSTFSLLKKLQAPMVCGL